MSESESGVFYFIVFKNYDFPDKRCLLLLDLYDDYDLDRTLASHTLASRKRFTDGKEALAYAKELATQHSLPIEIDDKDLRQENAYLD